MSKSISSSSSRWAAAVAALFVASLVTVSVVFAHPSSLECGTDATTRLAVGKAIMGMNTIAGDPKADNITVTVKTLGTAKSVVVDAGANNFFALRLMGGGSLAPADATLNLTSQCNVQVYTPNGAGGKYVAAIKGGAAGGKVVLGYNSQGPAVAVKIIEASL